MRINSTTGNQNKPTTTPRRSVYDGQSRCGDIQQQTDGFLARDRQGRELGVFGSLAEAATQIWRVARGQAGDVS